jgi:hypothetical protein
MIRGKIELMPADACSLQAAVQLQAGVSQATLQAVLLSPPLKLFCTSCCTLLDSFLSFSKSAACTAANQLLVPGSFKQVAGSGW